MRKSIFAIIVLCGATLVLFQNCGKEAATGSVDTLDQQGSNSGGSSTGGTTNGGTTGGTTTGGSTTGASAEITKDITGGIFFSKPDGHEVSVEMKSLADVSYAWDVSGKKINTVVPKLLIDSVGNLKVSVIAKHTNGTTDSSSATVLISRYAMIDGVVKYLYLTTSDKYYVVPSVDKTTFKLIGVTHAADKDGLFVGLTKLKLANALSANELSDNVVVIGSTVYYGATAIAGADAATFSVIGQSGYSKDKSKVFCRGTVITNSDPKTFDVPFAPILNFAKDGGNLFGGCKHLMAYSSFKEVAPKDPAQSFRFLKIDGKYYYLSGTTSITVDPAFYPLPFTPTSEAGLSMVSVGDFKFVTDGTNQAILAGKKFELVTKKFDLTSLTKVSNYFYKDKNGVYFYKSGGVWETVAHAKSSTFKKLGSESLHTDGTRAWISYYNYAYSEIKVKNMASLTAMGFNHYADKFGYYIIKFDLANKTVSSVKIDGVIAPLTMKKVDGSGYIYNATQIFLITDNGGTLVAGVFPSTFKVIDHWAIAVGSKLVVYGILVPGIDGSKLKQIGKSYFFEDTKTVVHYIGTTLKKITTNVSKFRFFNEAISNHYVTDGTSVWCDERPVTQAHIPTFKVTSNAHAEDRKYRYTWGIISSTK